MRGWRRAASSGAPLNLRVGCTWRSPGETETATAAPAGFVQYRRQMAQAGAPLTFRMPSLELKLAVRFGCIGAAAMSGRHAGIVTPSNALLCGNKSEWWGFIGHNNVDGLLRNLAGPGLEQECDALPPVSPGINDKLLPSTARATGAHALEARYLLHAHAPLSAYPRQPAELALRRTYTRCLALSAELGIASLAVPALGCGVAGFPPAIGARAALDGLEEAVGLGLWSATDDGEQEPGRRAMPLVEFVLLDERVYAAFADAAHMRFAQRSEQDT